MDKPDPTVCPDCGGRKWPKSARCQACAHRHQHGENNPNWRGGAMPAKFYASRSAARFPDHWAARQQTRQMLRSGQLKRQPCELCGNPDTVEHHDDYNRPEQVRWLCKSHHRQVHNGMGWKGHKCDMRPKPEQMQEGGLS